MNQYTLFQTVGNIRASFTGRRRTSVGEVGCLGGITPPVHVISHFNLNQEAITWNERLPRRSHEPVYFQNGFGTNLEYVLNPTNQSAKPTDLKILIFAFSVNDATFSFLISLYSNCVHGVVDIPFLREKNFPKMCLKINRSVKTP